MWYNDYMYGFFKKQTQIAKIRICHYARKNSFLLRAKTLRAKSHITSAIEKNVLELRNNNGAVAVSGFFATHKKQTIIALIALIVAIAAFIVVYNKIVVYEYSYNGQVLGVVKNESQVYEAVSRAEDSLSTPEGAKILLNNIEDINVKRIVSFEYKKEDLDTEEDIISNISSAEGLDVKGYNVVVNGHVLGILKSEKDGAILLNMVRDYYLGDTNKDIYKKISFVENVSYEEIKTTPDKILSVEEIYNNIVAGAIQLSTYEVLDGEKPFDIALKNGMQVERLEQLNPAIDMDLVQGGDILQIEKQQALISLETVESAEYDAEEPYNTEYFDTDELYSDEIEVIDPGKVGIKRIVADVIKINGLEMDRIVQSSVNIEDPVTRVISRGTKKRPAPISKGFFIWPANGIITSEFGGRESPGGIGSTNHRGLDIGVSFGSVLAADGGIVTIAGDQGAYGKAIKIDHGNGKATFYAHLSKIDVSVGEKVYQGQRIATSGNTGVSTGPHLHFEVHINGIQVNPRKYLD